MNEEQWLSCTDPIAMLKFLRGSLTSEDSVPYRQRPGAWPFEGADKGNDRKFRLFACACCRRIWEKIPEPCNRDAVAAVEDFLEGRLPAPAVEAAICASSGVEFKEDGSKRSEPGYWAVKYLGRGFYKMTAAASAITVASKVIGMVDEEYGREAEHAFYVSLPRPFQWPTPMPAAVEAECAAQAGLLRCIFGNPFRPPALDRSLLAWNDGTVAKLATALYEEQSFGRLPILADALEDAGCGEQELLGHLRGPGPHVRGCYVLDLLLGKV